VHRRVLARRVGGDHNLNRCAILNAGPIWVVVVAPDYHPDPHVRGAGLRGRVCHVLRHHLSASGIRLVAQFERDRGARAIPGARKNHVRVVARKQYRQSWLRTM
jgi:hypothetical protein